FLGALNDNLFKNAVVILLAFGAAAGADADVMVNVTAALFIAPFFLFSAAAGQLPDRLQKGRLIRLIKLAEIALMTIDAVRVVGQSSVVLLAVIFLMGTHSAFFGPAKMSILPQHLAEDELVTGNALVQLGTFVAILAGTILGGFFVSLGREGLATVATGGVIL